MKKNPLLLLLLFLAACSNPSDATDGNEPSNESIEFFGNTQGTTFSVIVNDDIDLTMEEVESTLNNFDLALSAYIPNSILTKVNEAPAGTIDYDDPYNYFGECFKRSHEIYLLSGGAFDPTVYPLVDGWGFMKDMENVPDSSTVDSLRALIGFGKGYHFSWLNVDRMKKVGDSYLVKNTPGAKLDFNAIAQGMAVDVLAEMIESKGGKNYFVEIGGEIRVKGKNKDGVFWRIGIDKPIESSDQSDREIHEIIQIDGRSVATSGSYRKFYIKNGEKYSHTLNPKTGYPVKHNLLSATVVADDCATADALATTFMVMGTEKTKSFLADHDSLNVEAYLIFTNDKDRLETYYTKGFAEMITE